MIKRIFIFILVLIPVSLSAQMSPPGVCDVQTYTLQNMTGYVVWSQVLNSYRFVGNDGVTWNCNSGSLDIGCALCSKLTVSIWNDQTQTWTVQVSSYNMTDNMACGGEYGTEMDIEYPYTTGQLALGATYRIQLNIGPTGSTGDCQNCVYGLTSTTTFNTPLQ